MIDWKRWLPGMPDDDTEDPVSKTLRTLQQGASDIGTGLSDAASSAGSALGSAAETARSYLPDIGANMAANRQAVEDANQGQQGGVDFGAGIAASPPGQVYGQALEQANQAEDQIAARSREVIPSGPLRTATDVLEPVHRGLAQAHALVQATPEAAYETANALGAPVGLGREGPLGVDVPVLGRVGPTDVALTLAPSRAVQAALQLPYGTHLPAEAGPAASRLTGALEEAGRAVAEPVRSALGTLREAAGGAVEGVGRALDANARNVAAADARMAEQGSTQLPGTLGVITDNPLEASRATRTHIVPPEVADQLGYPVRNPTDPAHLRAIEAAGGTVDERGTTMNVIRMSDPEAAGGDATRGALFYTAGAPGSPSPYAKTGTAGPGGVGGQQRIEGQTRFRSPLIISDAPGEAAGFDDAMRQMGATEHPNVVAARRAVEETKAADEAAYARRYDAMQRWYDANPRWTEEQADAFRASPEYARLTDEVLTVSQAHLNARSALRAAEEANPSVAAATVEDGIRSAKRAGPAGSPGRAQALKDLVSRYGGDPELIDPLIGLRGADMGESVYAVKENIVAHNARARGYDGVITVQQGSIPVSEVNKHPAVVAAKAAVASAEIERTRVALTRGSYEEAAAATKASEDAYAALSEARDQAARELAPHKITELMDPREARNPTPGAATPDHPEVIAARAREEQAREWVRDVKRQADEGVATWQRENPGADPMEFWRGLPGQAIERGMADVNERLRIAKAAHAEARRAYPLPPSAAPGYALREDIPRAPGTRASTIVENPRYADVDQAYTAAAERSKAAQAAATAAEDAHQATPNAANWRAYRAAQDELVSARSAWDDARTALDAELERGRYVTAAPEPPGSTTASGTAGTLPAAGAAPDRLAAVNRVLGQGVASTFSGGTGAAVAGVTDPGSPQGEDESDADYAIRRTREVGQRMGTGFAVGALGPLAAQRGIRAGLRAAGRLGEEGGARGALATLGGAPVPTRRAAAAAAGTPTAAAQELGAGFVARFPGAQKAIAASQARAANMAARGITAPSRWDWLKQAGYSGIYGPATATAQLAGGAVDLALAQPKELTRAIVQGRPGAYGRQVRAQAAAIPEALSGVRDIIAGRGGAAGSAAASGGSPGTAGLSERLVNPIEHAAARAMEYPGEVLAEAPDAVFRPLFNAQGMQREADTIAREMGYTGARADSYADTLLQSAENLRAHPATRSTSKEAQRVVAAGKAYADEMGYKGDPGGAGVWIGKQAKRDDFTGFVASFLVPFTRTSANIGQAAARSTPGVGLLPGVRRGRPIKSFDVMYDQAFGTLAASGLAAYAATGGITGSGPADKNERDGLIAKGWQPRSIRVGDHYVPNRALGKFQPILDTIGEAHDWWAYGKPGAGGMAYSADAVKRLGNIATDQIGLSGLADIYSIVDGGLGSQGPGLVARSLTRYVPYGGIIRAAALAADPNARKPDRWQDTPMPAGASLGEKVVGGLEDVGSAVGQQIAQNIPGLRGGVPMAQDPLGRPLPNPQEGLGVLVPRTTTAREDPIISAYQAADVPLGGPPDTLDGVTLTPAQQRRYQTVRGQEVQRLAGPMVSRDTWAQTPAQTQKLLLQTYLDTARTLAEVAVSREGGQPFSEGRTKAIIDKALGR